MTFPGEFPDQLCCYNLDHTQTPGQMKVRWKIRIAAGAEAKRLDQLQQQAIIDLLTWADKRRGYAINNQETSTEIPDRNSSEPIQLQVQKA